MPTLEQRAAGRSAGGRVRPILGGRAVLIIDPINLRVLVACEFSGTWSQYAERVLAA